MEITASGVAHHPSILDMGDPTQNDRFVDLMQHTEIPHVDIKLPTSEMHMRKDKFGRFDPDSVKATIRAAHEDHIGLNYSFAGFSLLDQPLSETLSPDVVSACIDRLGQDCLEPTLHARTLIQHANYDQFAHCVVRMVI